ncbi:MAG: hypothetical protein E5W76_22740 [Mesorhizobium sp.]|nr:MAG: hypothetical protein E5W76_22740 [Mesorhizobium sp.]
MTTDVLAPIIEAHRRGRVSPGLFSFHHWRPSYATTARAARQIIDGEAAERERKTERLRQARLAMQAVEAASPAARSPAKKRTGRRKQA